MGFIGSIWNGSILNQVGKALFGGNTSHARAGGNQTSQTPMAKDVYVPSPKAAQSSNSTASTALASGDGTPSEKACIDKIAAIADGGVASNKPGDSYEDLNGLRYRLETIETVASLGPASSRTLQSIEAKASAALACEAASTSWDGYTRFDHLYDAEVNIQAVADAAKSLLG